MDFGKALELLKNSKRMTRLGWNAKNQFVVMQKAYPEGIPCNKQTADAFGYKEGDLFKCMPYFQLRCANGTHAMWVPSVTDILAEDWVEVGSKEMPMGVKSNYTFGNHDKRYSGLCPRCNSSLENGKKFPEPYLYCPDCGQRLDWRD